MFENKTYRMILANHTLKQLKKCLRNVRHINATFILSSQDLTTILHKSFRLLCNTYIFFSGFSLDRLKNTIL